MIDHHDGSQEFHGAICGDGDKKHDALRSIAVINWEHETTKKRCADTKGSRNDSAKKRRKRVHNGVVAEGGLIKLSHSSEPPGEELNTLECDYDYKTDYGTLPRNSPQGSSLVARQHVGLPGNVSRLVFYS